MADPRKVPFVTLASYSTAAASATPGPDCKKRRREEDGEVANLHHPRDGALAGGPGSPAAGVSAAAGSSAPSGLFSNGRSSGEPAPGAAVSTSTVRLTLALSEPGDKTFTEFNYSELVQATQQVKKPPDVLAPALDPNDPLADKDQERLEVEALARKFESKYGCAGKKKKKDRMQDLIDIGYGYDESDSFIDNSEAYDELVPASLNTKLGGFYINTGTLQFRAASESEDEDTGKDGIHFKKLKDGDERAIKRRKKKQDGTLEEKKPRKNRVPKPGVSALNRPEKKKRKKLMKDSLTLAAMLRRFSREKEEIRKKNLTPPTSFKSPNPNRTLNSHSITPNNDLADLTNDPSVFPLLNTANDDVLQDLMGELDFAMLDPLESSGQEGQGENGGVQRGGGPLSNRVQRSSLIPPPPLPSGLPPPLLKRIEDLRAASRQFDMEGRKKFFTLDMNNILLDIELQVQEQPVEVRSAVYSHLEAFVPCNKEALMKRLKKLSLNVQDDRLRNPLLKLKLAVCNAMPEQIARYNMDCLAKVAKQQSEEGERNGSEEEDEERPGKRVMGPRKKFVWDDKLRTLLCNLVRAKLCCYEVEGQNSPSPEDYLKAFMETEVKPLWPKGWMQARMLIKESRIAHSHLTGNTVKKRVVPTPKAKLKPQDGGWLQQSTVSTATSTPLSLAHRAPSPPEPICLSDSLDEDLGGGQSLDSISQALALLSSAAKGLIQPDGPVSPEAPKPTIAASSVGPTSSVNSSPQIIKKTPVIAASPVTSSPLIVSSSAPSSSPSLPISRPQHAHTSPVVRTDALVGVKAATEVLAQTQRRVTTTTTPQRPVPMSLNVKPATVSSPKPRPPPTASPLLPPQKGYNTPLSTPTSLHKLSNNSSVVRIGGVSTTPTSQAHSPALSIASTFSPSPSSSTPASPHLNAKPQVKNSSPSPALPKPHPQPQSTFVTPMQATLTKSPHSASSPILKLTPRVTLASSPLPTLSRTTTLPSMHQYSKSPGFHAGFSGVGSGYSTAVGQQKNPSQVNSTGLTSTSITKHASPVAGSANHVQRQRPVSAANQGAKTLVSVSSASGPQLAQVSSAGGTLLASGAANLPLNFGMLGGLAPGSLSFTFPNLMNLPTVTGTSAAAGTANQSSSGYSLQPNVNQNQSGDLKRKL